MAGLADVRKAALQIVGPVCGNKAMSYGEADIGRMLHAYLLAGYAATSREHPILVGKVERRVDFRFGDKPHGSNPCLFELAVRNSEHGQQLHWSQNKSELQKLSRYPSSRAKVRALLLLDIGHTPIEQHALQRGYDDYCLGRGNFPRYTVSVLYVHRNLDYRFVWRPTAN